MTNNTDYTFTAYLGVDFQQRLMWQLLVEPEFAEKTIPELAIEYFDDPNLKRLFIIMLEYFKEYEKVPNLQNKSIHQAINEYKTPNNLIEEESLFAIIKRIELWNERIINKQMLYDGDAVRKSTKSFIKQQEYRKLSESIQEKVKNGDIKSKYAINAIEERFFKIAHIGEEEDDCESVTEGLRKALRKEFRQTIPTGIETIDVLTGGGLGKGEIGVVLTPSGVGKTTFLTKVANSAYEQGKNVAQIVFEDTKDQIRRKHCVIWAESSLTKLNDEDEADRVFDVATAYLEDLEKRNNGSGRLMVKRFSQEDTTIKDVKNWMLGYEKKYGFKFDILILDYLDCLESHKKTPDRNEAELAIVKGFEALAAELDIPAWTAIQSNRSGFGSEFVEAHQSGGSIKRIQKAHFFMSIAKTPAQQEANFANIRIIKARFAKDGQAFEDCVFNNDTLQIIIDDPRYRYSKNYKNLKHYDETDINKLEKKADSLSNMVHVAVSQHTEGEILGKINDESINDIRSESQKYNDLLRENLRPEEPQNEIDNAHVSTSGTDLNTDELKSIVDYATETINEDVVQDKIVDNLLEIDETVDVEQLDDVVSDTVNDAVSDTVNDNTLLDWSGETITHTTSNPHVKLVDIEPKVEIEEKPIESIQFKSPGMTIQEPPSTKFNGDDDDILGKILGIDPDAPQGDNKFMTDMLVKKRNYQHVINKK